MLPHSSDERRALLDLAREAIVEAVHHGRIAPAPSAAGALGKPSGAFVTLHRRGRLCGCIGQVEPSQSLAETVVHCAICAALEDPRFPPVRPEEVGELEIEISILSPLEPIQPEKIEVGRHGLLVARSDRRGVLLPQVAVEHHWARERFLEEACVKAGLEREAWRNPATSVSAFTAEVFSETDLHPRREVQAN